MIRSGTLKCFNDDMPYNVYIYIYVIYVYIYTYDKWPRMVRMSLWAWLVDDRPYESAMIT